jgi:hypothetical protein
MSIIGDIVKDVAVALVPQPGQGEPPHVYHWRQVVAFSIVIIGGATVMHIAWACGLLTFAGMTGFATAADLKTQQAVVLDIRVTQIENAIKTAKSANCIAQREGNMLALNYSSEDLNKRLTEYFNATGHPYPRVPECAELLATVR